MSMDFSESPYPWLLCPIGRNWRLQRQGKVSTGDSSARAKVHTGVPTVTGVNLSKAFINCTSLLSISSIADQTGVSKRHGCWNPKRKQITKTSGKKPSEPN